MRQPRRATQKGGVVVAVVAAHALLGLSWRPHSAMVTAKRAQGGEALRGTKKAEGVNDVGESRPHRLRRRRRAQSVPEMSAEYSCVELLATSPFASLKDASGVETLSTVSECDDCVETVTLPFDFPWFDTTISSIVVASNGQINADGSDANDYLPRPIDGTHGDRIAVAQADLDPSSAGTVYYKSTSTSAIVSFEGVPFLRNQDTPSPGSPSSGGSSSSGLDLVEDVGGAVFAQVELYSDGIVEIRWGDDGSVPEATRFAAGVEASSVTSLPFDIVDARGLYFPVTNKTNSVFATGNGLATAASWPSDGDGSEGEHDGVRFSCGQFSDAPSVMPSFAPSPLPTTSAPSMDAPCLCDQTLRLEVTTDRFPEESTWTVDALDRSPECAVLTASGGPFNESLRFYDVVISESVCAGEKYRFTMLDAQNDGMCCEFGDGSYKLFLDDTLVASGAEFAGRDPTVFTAPVTPAPHPSSDEPTHPCGACDQSLRLELLTDGFPSETSWEIDDLGRRPICPVGGSLESASGGNFTLGYTLYDVLISDDICGGENYTFAVKDTFGDGLCCDYGVGYFKVYLNDDLLGQGDEFGDEARFTFTAPYLAARPTAPTAKPVLAPTKNPTFRPTPKPTFVAPTILPTKKPTLEPVPAPTAYVPPVTSPVAAPPVADPVPSPTKAPFPAPSLAPVPKPTKSPIPAPTKSPIPAPTKSPIPAPTKSPIPAPTKAPIPRPTAEPTGLTPTSQPTAFFFPPSFL